MNDWIDTSSHTPKYYLSYYLNLNTYAITFSTVNIHLIVLLHMYVYHHIYIKINT